MRSLILLTALVFSLIPTERVTAKNPDPPNPLGKGGPEMEYKIEYKLQYNPKTLKSLRPPL